MCLANLKITVIKLRIFPFDLSLSKGEWKNTAPEVKPFMLRQAQHERLNLVVVSLKIGGNHLKVFKCFNFSLILISRPRSTGW
jgi:hypothetical protein